MNNNKKGFRWFSEIFASLYFLDISSLSIGRINPFMHGHVILLKTLILKYLGFVPNYSKLQ